MSLLKQSTTTAFDTSAIHKGDLIRAQYHTWTEPRNGIVTHADDNTILVLYLPGIRNVSNYYPITAEEVKAGKWTVLWSSDLETINKHDPAPEVLDGDGEVDDEL